MKKQHEYIHAFDTIRYFNQVVDLGDLCLTLLENKYINGILIDPPKTLNDLRGYIKSNCGRITSIGDKLATFINGHPSFDLTQYTDMAQQDVLSDKSISDEFASTLSTDVDGASIKSLEELAGLAELTSNTLTYAIPIKYSRTPQHYANTLNDLLDAASYTLRNINHNKGNVEVYSDEQKRFIVRGFLAQFPNFANIVYPEELEEDVSNMSQIADQVLSQLGSVDLIVLADLIDTNVPKVPIIRRLWAIG